MSTPPTHALLVSSDVKFLEATEKALHAAWPGCKVQRSHPEGDLAIPKVILAQPGSFTVIDRRYRLKLELESLLTRSAQAGGRVVAVSAVPRKSNELQQVVVDQGFDLLSHNLSWTSPRLTQAILTAQQTRGFAALSKEGLVAQAGGEATIQDSQHKSHYVEELASQLGEAGVQRTRRGKIASAVDELLMNAIYHAPKAAGAQVAAPVDIRWQIDEKGSFRATVVDRYGTYSREEAHRKLVNYLANEMVEVTQTAGRGGGVGLFLVFKVSTEYHLYVAPGRKTEICIQVLTAGKPGQGLGINPDGTRAYREILVYFESVNSARPSSG